MFSNNEYKKPALLSEEVCSTTESCLLKHQSSKQIKLPDDQFRGEVI